MASSANNLGTAYIRIAPQMEGIQSTITRQLGGLGSTAGSQFSNNFTAKWGAVAGAVAGLTSTVVSKAANMISNSLDDAIKRVDILNAFPKIMKNLGFSTEESNNALNKLSDRIEGLPTTLDEIVVYTQRLASTTNNLNKGMYNATNLAIAFNDAALSSGKGQYEANRAFEQFVQVISRGRPSMQDWKIMMEVMPGQLKQMAQYMATNNKSLQQYAKDAKKTTAELDGMDLYNWISEDKNAYAKERLQDLQKAMIDLDNKGGAGITAFKDQVGDATHTIGNALRLVQVRITKAMAKVIQAFGAGDIYDVISKFTSSFNDVGDFLAKNVVPVIKDALAPVLGALVPVIKTVAGAVGSFIKTLAGSSFVQTIVSSLLAILPKLITFIGSIISVLLQLASICTIVFDAIWTNLLQPIYDKVMPIISWVVGSLGTVFKTLAELIESQLGNIKAFIEGFFIGLKAGATATKNFFIEIVRGIIAIFQPVISAVKAVFLKVVSDIKTVMSPIINFFKDVLKKIKEVFSGVKEIGKNIVKGLWEGIKDMAAWVKEKIKGFSEDVLQGIKDFFGIKSPSKVMAEQGKYIAEGLALGITKNAKYAVSAMGDMASDVFEASKLTTDVGMNGSTPLSPGATANGMYDPNRQLATAQVVQNNVFNQVASDLDVKEASRLLGWQVATTI